MINNFYKNNDYELILKKNCVYIKNYNKLYDLNYLQIVITVKDNKIFINGSNLLIVKMDENDIEIRGIIKEIKLENE